MYVPTYWVAANDLWQRDEYSHAPLILIISLFLFWQARRKICMAANQPLPALGWLLFILGIMSYWLGRQFNISSVEFLSQPIIVAALLLIIKGRSALHATWFAVFYLIFMVPLPGAIVDAATGPLKQWISTVVVDLLFVVGYPVARTGVLISIGPYQLLVADACSGLNSMITLSALGVLFMHIVARENRLCNSIMLASILPIALVANTVRVLILVLATYHGGDEFAQGFLHSAAGIILMLVALGLLFSLDAIMYRRNSEIVTSHTVK